MIKKDSQVFIFVVPVIYSLVCVGKNSRMEGTLCFEGLISTSVQGFLTDILFWHGWIWKKLLSPAADHLAREQNPAWECSLNPLR